MPRYFVCAPLSGTAFIEVTAENIEEAKKIALSEGVWHGAVGSHYADEAPGAWAFEPGECTVDCEIDQLDAEEIK